MTSASVPRPPQDASQDARQDAPTGAPADAIQAAVAAAGSLRGTLRLARELVLARREIDLAGLDDQVGRLCAGALDLPPDQAARVRPELSSLLATVDALNEALSDAAGP